MRKVLNLSVFVLAAMMAFVFVSCSKKSSSSTTASSSVASVPSEQPEQATTTSDDDDITKGDKVKWSWYCVLPDNHPSITAYQKVFDEIKNETNGRITITMTAGGILGTEQEGFDMIRNGDVEGGMMNISYYENYVPESQGWLMPYTFTDYRNALRYFNEQVIPTIFNTKIADETNTIALNAVSPGFRNLTCNVSAKKPEDLKGVRVRSMESPMSISYVAGLGASPVPLAWAEVYMGLQTGTIQGQENPIAHIQAYNLFEVQKYLIMTQHALTLSFSIVNRDKWNSLSEKDRNYLAKKFAEQNTTAQDEVLEYQEDTFGKLESQYGMTVYRPEDIDLQAFVDNSSAYLSKNFTDSKYDGCWAYRNNAQKWISENCK